MLDPDQWDPSDVNCFKMHVSSVDRGLPVLSQITNLIDETFSTFNNTTIFAIKRGRNPYKKDPYWYLTTDECSLTLKKFGGGILRHRKGTMR